MFFQWEDKEDDESEIFAFSDRTGQGANSLTSDHPSLSHNAMMPPVQAKGTPVKTRMVSITLW